MSAESKLEVDWQESCKRRRDAAAENLIHFISDWIEDQENQDLSKEKVLDLLDKLLKAQEKVQFWNHNDRTSTDSFAISRCQHRLQRNQYTKLSMIKGGHEKLANLLTHYSGVPFIFPTLYLSKIGKIREIFLYLSTFFETILERLRKMTSTLLQN